MRKFVAAFLRIHAREEFTRGVDDVVKTQTALRPLVDKATSRRLSVTTATLLPVAPLPLNHRHVPSNFSPAVKFAMHFFFLPKPPRPVFACFVAARFKQNSPHLREIACSLLLESFVFSLADSERDGLDCGHVPGIRAAQPTGGRRYEGHEGESLRFSIARL